MECAKGKEYANSPSVKVNPKQLALLGTSADPPTNGHRALLEGLSKLFPRVITWASDNPLKVHSASLLQRQELLEILVEDLNVPHLEINQSLSSPWAIKTLEKAEELWPNAELILVVGSDLTHQIPRWVKSKDILKKARLGIAPREGWPVNELDLSKLKALGGEITVLPLNIPESASSSIRNETKITHIPTAILPTLIKENLYGLSKHT